MEIPLSITDVERVYSTSETSSGALIAAGGDAGGSGDGDKSIWSGWTKGERFARFG